MPSRLKLAAIVATAGLGCGVFVASATLGACIDGAGLDLPTEPRSDATAPVGTTVSPRGDGGSSTSADAGCSPDLTSDPGNCGACGKVCAAPSPDAGGSSQVAVCVDSVCGLACAASRADCNGVASDGCEVATATDAKNCGACGVSCGTQACTAGHCPYDVLVEKGGTFGEISVDDAGVYAAATAPVAGVFALPKAGGTPAILAKAAAGAGIALDGQGHLVFADTSSSTIDQVATTPPGDAGATAGVAIYAGVTGPRELSYAGSTLLWTQLYNNLDPTTPSASGIFTTGQALVASSTSYVYFLASTATGVWWADQNWITTPTADPTTAVASSVMGCALPCVTPGPVVPGLYRIFDVATDGTNLFWDAWGNVDDKSGTLAYCRIASCLPATLVGALAQPQAIVSDAVTVYWYEAGPGAIRALTLPVGGAKPGAPRTLASGLTGVTNLAIDRTYIYWDQPSLGEIDRAVR